MVGGLAATLLLMKEKPLRFATFLAPSILPVYRFVTEYVGRTLGYKTVLVVGKRFDEFAGGEADVGFICGLPYVRLADVDPSPIELLAAPVLQGARYGGKPVYYSDVVVRRDSTFMRFEDLRGRSWSFNGHDSHSGYNVTRHRLTQVGDGGKRSFFGRIVDAGWHQESLRLVREGHIDASAIDSQVLAVAMRDNPTLGEELRVIDTMGPSTMQPVVASRRLPETLRADIRAVLLEMAEDPEAREQLAYGFVERFAPVSDATYDDIRRMLTIVKAAGMAEW